MYLFYTLIVGLVANVFYYFAIKGVYKDIYNRSSDSENDFNLFSFISMMSKYADEIDTYTTIYKIVMFLCVISFFIFLFFAARTLMETEDSELASNSFLNSHSDDEILTSGERMKRMMENSDSNNS